ncbi:MAG: L,D-transpeptidase [Allgaiera sp.]|jgi:lipoprotein-anchoring transpeptidase ErfK/SrfK|nr:L,D-transpeptidase [Allgaiera sp.]
MTFAKPTVLVSRRQTLRALGAFAMTGAVAACAGRPNDVAKAQTDPAVAAVEAPSPTTIARYQAIQDHGYTIDAVDPGYLTGSNARALVYYNGSEQPGHIVIDPYARRLYLVLENGIAIRYGCAVGKQGTTFSGDGVIQRKVEWPSWRPTQNMIKTEPEKYGDYAEGVEGGPENPLGARALYLYRGGRDTYYRIHGTNNPSTIGRATSAGCIRLFDQDIIDLYNRVPRGTQVHVRTPDESAMMIGPLRPGFDGYVIPVNDPDQKVTGPLADQILDNSETATDVAVASATQALSAQQPQLTPIATGTPKKVY